MNKTFVRFYKLIEENNWKVLKKEISKLDSAELSDVINSLSKKKQILLIRLLTEKEIISCFHNLTNESQKNVIEGLISHKYDISVLLNNMAPDVRTDFLENLPEDLSAKLVEMLSTEEREITTDLLSYPENSIGRLMTPEYVAVNPDFTVTQTLQKIRELGNDSETINVIYVIDNKGKLIDDIKIKEIILASPNEIISNIGDNRFVSLNAYDDEETAIKSFLDYDRVAMPVTDKNGILIGIVTFDDVMHVVEEEGSKDLQKFGAMSDGIINPLKASLFTLYKYRIVWLLALVFMNIFSGAALANFQSVIESAVALVFFLPLLIDSSGNAGSQSATLMIRALAVGDVQTKDWIRLLAREVIVAIMLGITMCLGVCIVAWFRAPEVAIIVGLTMLCSVLTGSLIGLLLPFIFTKLKLDPATASAPLITSISDILGVVIYFSIASWYLGI